MEPRRGRERLMFSVGGGVLALVIFSFVLSNQAAQSQRDCSAPSAQTNGTNIVLFYADDWTWKTLGLINAAVRTPHLDALARRGIRFSHNCVTTSICWQSRATLVTGLYASRHQQWNVDDDHMFDTTVRWSKTLFPLLKSAGYRVGFVGKWHAPMPEKYRQITFDYFENYYGQHWLMRNGALRHVTDLNQEDALHFLRNLRRSSSDSGGGNRPPKFALTVSFFATHAYDEGMYPYQYNPQNYSEALYRNVTIPVPPSATQAAWEVLPWFFTDENFGRVRWAQRYNTPERFQVTMKQIYRMASEVDDVVGAVIAELEEMGVRNETLIVFTSDNGSFHGEHGLADKWYPHEESIRVPLIVHDPRMPPDAHGSEIDQFTLNLDLAPTLLAAAGIEIPLHMQGRDLAQLYYTTAEKASMTAAAQAWRPDFFYEWWQGNSTSQYSMWEIPAVFTLVRKDYKYMYWPQTGFEQLFRVGFDPYEQIDVFNETLESHPTLVRQIKDRFETLRNLSQSGHAV